MFPLADKPDEEDRYNGHQGAQDESMVIDPHVVPQEACDPVGKNRPKSVERCPCPDDRPHNASRKVISGAGAVNGKGRAIEDGKKPDKKTQPCPRLPQSAMRKREPAIKLLEIMMVFLRPR